jgi:RNA polymerase sigma factor (sigma-70 family)
MERLLKNLFGFNLDRLFNNKLKMTDSQRLLADYVQNGSEPAFQELVSRYLDLVYSTATRLVGGNRHMAEDVAQTVFTDLARKARRLPHDVMLGGWLHRHTCFVAATTMRSERRRQHWEKQAMEMKALHDDSKATMAAIAPVLDEAINQLGADDRSAILLRFYEQHDFRSVGTALGSNEDAARMRVSRALEKLHALLKHRGVSLSAGALATVLAAESITAAPAGLAITISGAAMASAAAGGTTFTILKLMSMTKLKLSLFGVVVAAGVATPVVMQHQAQLKLRAENQALQQQVDQLAQFRAENDRLSNLVVQAKSQPLSDEQFHELIKLRGEVGGLRRQQKELEKLRAQLTASQSAPAPKPVTSAPVQDFPKESWAFAGYASPEATLQSWTWAMSKGDKQAMLACLTPERQKEWGKLFEGKTDSELAAEGISGSSKITGYQILNRIPISEDEVLLEAGMNGDKNGHKLKLKKIGGEWKVDGPDDK